MRSRSEPDKDKDKDKDNESEVLDDFLGATVITPSSWLKKKSTWHIGRNDRLKMPSCLGECIFWVIRAVPIANDHQKGF
jgi:hypothetical protein